MKVMLDIKDNKAEFFMELIKNFPFVKAQPLSDGKAKILEELKEAVDNMKLVKEGKLKGRPARELLDEL